MVFELVFVEFEIAIQNELELIQPLHQCFSTFLRLRNPKWTQKNWQNPNFGGKTLPCTIKIKDFLIIILLYLVSISWPLYVASRYCNLLTCRDGAIRQREIRISKNILNAFQSLSQTHLMVVSINKCA